MKLARILACIIFLAAVGGAADVLFKTTMAYHVTALVSVPTSPTALYTTSVWIQSIELVPQSTTSPTCTIQDRAGSPNVAYNAVALSPNHSYRDERLGIPLYMASGITWSCSDSTVKAQITVRY